MHFHSVGSGLHAGYGEASGVRDRCGRGPDDFDMQGGDANEDADLKEL